MTLARTAGASRHLGDEAESPAVDRPDEALRPAVVAERLARGLDAARDRGLGDDAAVPDLLDDLVLADQALVVLDQQGEQREDLRLERADAPSARSSALARSSSKGSKR